MAAGTDGQQQQRPPRVPQHGPRVNLEPIDREKTCPLLLRVFTQNNDHHSPEEFAVRGKEPRDEVQIYTWKDATLRELADLVKEVAPVARRRDAKLSFAFVYPDRRGKITLRQVGVVNSQANKRSECDEKQLRELEFEIGDFLDVAIKTNN